MRDLFPKLVGVSALGLSVVLPTRCNRGPCEGLISKVGWRIIALGSFALVSSMRYRSDVDS